MTNNGSIQGNMLAIKAVTEKVKFSFHKAKTDNRIALARSDFPTEFWDQFDETKEAKPKELFTDFTITADADYCLEIDLPNSRNFAKHYYRHLLQQFFLKQKTIISEGFTEDLLVYTQKSANHELYTSYDVFQLRFSYNDWSDDILLMVSSKGTTLVLKNSFFALSGDLEPLVSRFLYNSQIYHKSRLTEEAKLNYDSVYPLVSNKLKTALNIRFNENLRNFSYSNNFQQIKDFSNYWFSNPAFAESFHIQPDQWVEVPESKVFRTKSESQFLLLGSAPGIAVRTPIGNLAKYGPYSLPKSKEIRFFAIFQENDRDAANELYKILLNEKPNSPAPAKYTNHASLYDFIKLKFNPDRDRTIRFRSMETMLEDVQNNLDQHHFDHIKQQYIAIYISPVSPKTNIEADRLHYYALKEKLLKYQISSQVIYKENIGLEAFKKYYIHNIAPALLAKAGGIPWQLKTTANEELVIGVGAYKSSKSKVQYIGSAFSFNRNGTFRQFNCISKSNLFVLAGDIKEMIIEHIADFGKPKRLVIHFYKNMKMEDMIHINRTLYNLGLKDLPVFIVTINKTLSTDYIAFDTAYPHLIPLSGTILQMSKNNYLLFNNTRYGGDYDKIESFHLPLKIRISSPQSELLEDIAVVKGLIDQVYQFSRIYWKSVKQQNLPVTLSYPTMLAEIYSHFKDEHLNDFARTNLWFL